MKVCILGGGGCFALNFANLCEERKIEHFGIGRSNKLPPFWVVDHDYRYSTVHLVEEHPILLRRLEQEQPDVIVNFAAQGEGAASFFQNAPDFFRTNTYGLSRLVVGLLDKKWLKRFIHIGSSEVYGSVETPSKETDLLNPSSPYAISKAAFDQYLQTMWKVYAFPMNIIRPSYCYTPGQQLHRVIPKAIICALSGKKLKLEGGGKAKKSYLHAIDLSKAILSVLDSPHIGATYNVGPVSPISIAALVNHIAEGCGVSFEELVEEVPDRVGQDSKYHLDSTLIAKDCGWTQTMNLARGLGTMIEWVKKYPELLQMDTTYRHRI